MYMTPRRKQVFDFINKYYKKHGYMPSLKEIGKKFKIAISSTWEHLDRLELMGLIRKAKGQKRGIEIL